MRPGYAIEYDYLPGTQVFHSLESKPLRNLYLAGQIIGTTGYEEAAALGIMAGINAARRTRNRDEVVLRRDEAYIGVLIDDLVTKEMDEPYRMHTSQAEFRLLLRQDNAEERLGGLAYELGLVDERRHEQLEDRRRQIADLITGLDHSWLRFDGETSARLDELGCRPTKQNVRARDFLCRTDVGIGILQELGLVTSDVSDEVAREVETSVKYAGYVARQEGEVRRLRRLEERTIPGDVQYDAVRGLRAESMERLTKIRPRTIGHASRVAGVTTSDISVLLVHLEQLRRQTVRG
jgi:tRNA uridine 5-carboxymethylaminomethyl modification enzyme